MSVIFLAAIAIAFMIMFLGGFAGFVVGDNTKNTAIIVTMATAPGFSFSYVLNSVPAFVLWVSSYLMGMFIADFIEAQK